MTKKSLVEITEDVFADVLAMFGLPGASASGLFGGFLRSKVDESLKILLAELRAGEVSSLHVASENETVAVCYRYLLAARDGVARRNLRLLARTMTGLAERDRLFSDEFNKYAGVLESLTRDQILYLGRYYALYQEEIQKTDDEGAARQTAKDRLTGELIPRHFPSEQHLEYLVSQAVGLGLLLTASAWGTLLYRFSPLMDEIAELADFQDVLRQEGEL